MRSAYNGGGSGNSQGGLSAIGQGPATILIDGTTLAPDHWWKLT
jgi:hypothetical protein